MAVMVETTIRPFTVEIPEADLEDLRARVAATRFPEKETVEDDSHRTVRCAGVDIIRRPRRDDRRCRGSHGASDDCSDAGECSARAPRR
jgi:hypothetical protein